MVSSMNDALILFGSFGSLGGGVDPGVAIGEILERKKNRELGVKSIAGVAHRGGEAFLLNLENQEWRGDVLKKRG